MNTKKITTLAMITAIAFALVALIRIPLFPAASFLTYEPKDVIIVIAGFMFGPIEALIVAVVVAFIELITISSTGFWGLLMNILSTAAFAVTASVIYHKNRTIKGAVIGLVSGVVCMTVMMLLWNYICTPIYMGYPRAAVAAMLPTVFLPFNLLKASLNAAFAMILYKPIVTALRKTGLLPGKDEKGLSINWIVVAAALAVIAVIVIYCLFIAK